MFELYEHFMSKWPWSDEMRMVTIVKEPDPTL